MLARNKRSSSTSRIFMCRVWPLAGAALRLGGQFLRGKIKYACRLGIQKFVSFALLAIHSTLVLRQSSST